ncbi:MAG TPA: cyclic nucleotide-binding domain-containing protein [Candidatus Binatia bacterium]|nr:cyclic nucleotide-binding domain-containing protein [Candidatus Binatia bacterium]
MADSAPLSLPTFGLFLNDPDAEEVPAGAVIFAQGDESQETMYAVAAGEIDVMLGTRVVETVPAGGILGELGLIVNTPRSATAVARVDSRVVPIDRKRFLFLTQQHPFFALFVMETMAARTLRLSESRHS